VSKNTLSDEDSALFRAKIGAVTPIKNDRIMLKPKTVVNNNRHESSFKELPPVIETLLSAQDPLSFLKTGVPKKTLKKLRRGAFEIEDGLDLHGLNSQEAQRYLANFLNECLYNQYRCVQIIHGKGYGSKDRHPVLKNNVNIWLREYSEVEAFCSAPIKAGGTGAVLVLLFCEL
jgi:DNA-nicking Smr family endonuclease